MKKRNNGVFWYLLIVGAFLCCMIWVNNLSNQASAYTRKNLVEDLKAGVVTAVTLEPSKEVPTGTVYVYMEKGDARHCKESDMTEHTHEDIHIGKYKKNPTNIL